MRIYESGAVLTSYGGRNAVGDLKGVGGSRSIKPDGSSPRLELLFSLSMWRRDLSLECVHQDLLSV